jgi:hypothetical protein
VVPLVELVETVVTVVPLVELVETVVTVVPLVELVETRPRDPNFDELIGGR